MFCCILHMWKKIKLCACWTFNEWKMFKYKCLPLTRATPKHRTQWPSTHERLKEGEALVSSLNPFASQNMLHLPLSNSTCTISVCPVHLLIRRRRDLYSCSRVRGKSCGRRGWGNLRNLQKLRDAGHLGCTSSLTTWKGWTKLLKNNSLRSYFS